ncbi:MAG: family 78 glycoside hydrolase catalytic domain [Clostridia bacterium]|nr:family 78 glycoside hydrolase catalytic domain [Clostridia bacterium]
MTVQNALSGARWIGTDYPGSPIIERRFILNAVPGDARLIITGLGYFSAKINGIPVSDDRFQPHITDYERRDFKKITYPCRDTFTHRIYVCSYPVSALLQNGDNILTVQLGDGFYRQHERVAEGEMAYGDILKTVFALTSGDGVLLTSDGTEVWYPSDIVRSALFLGEVHDRTVTDRTVHPVMTLPPPDSVLCEQIGTPDRVIRTIRPKYLGCVGGRHIWDAGENTSGVVRVTKPDGKVILRFAEELAEDGSLDFSTTGAGYTCTSGVPQIMTDTFIGAGTFEPQFVWHAFRYFDVEGEIDTAEVLVIHADTPITSSFSSPSEGLNFLYEAFIRSQLTNMHGSIPSDCPHRERLGYTGDGQNCAEAAMMLLDSRDFYRKWIRDILDCQSPDTGHIQHTAPFQGGGGGPGGWGCAVVIVPYAYYRQYGEKEMLALTYPAMQKWVGYLLDHSEGGLVVREEDGGWCLGDWCTFDPCILPEPFVNTYYFVRVLDMLTEIASVLDLPDDRTQYAALAQNCRDALTRTYFADGHFCGGVQGADAYALDIDLLPDDAACALAAKYDALGCFDTGFLGTDILLRVLLAHGHADTVYNLLSSDACGSFLYMKHNNATTLWEDWHGGGSHNHPMFGAPARLLFSGFLGIKNAAPGWESIRIAPQMPAQLDDIEGSLDTPRGRITVSLHREHGVLHASVTLPENTAGTFCCGDTTLALHGGENIIHGKESIS